MNLNDLKLGYTIALRNSQRKRQISISSRFVVCYNTFNQSCLIIVRYYEMYKITKGTEGCVTLYAGLSLRCIQSDQKVGQYNRIDGV